MSVLNGDMTQLTRISPRKGFAVYVRWDLKPCCTCNSGRYCSRDCHYKQFNEHEKYCRYISELESLEQEKLKYYSEDYSVTENETLPTKLRHSLPNFEISRNIGIIVGKRPLINCYLSNATFEGFRDTGSMVSLLGKKWLREMLPGVSTLSLQQFMGVSDWYLLKWGTN